MTHHFFDNCNQVSLNYFSLILKTNWEQMHWDSLGIMYRIDLRVYPFLNFKHNVIVTEKHLKNKFRQDNNFPIGKTIFLQTIWNVLSEYKNYLQKFQFRQELIRSDRRYMYKFPIGKIPVWIELLQKIPYFNKKYNSPEY